MRAAGGAVAVADGSGDSYLFLWDLWWVRQALGGGLPEVAGQSLLHTRMLFWPEGVSLGFHTLAPTLGILALPLQWIWPGTDGLVRALTLLVVLSFVSTGLVVLLLARQAGASRGAALGAGLLAILQPYRLHHLNHLNLLSVQFGLLTLWWLVRVLRHGRWRDAAGLAVTAALTSGTDLEGAVHVALAAALLTAWELGVAWRQARLAPGRHGQPAAGLRGRLLAWRRPLGALGLGIVLALLLHLPLLRSLRAAGPVAAPPPRAAEHLSANLLGLVAPGGFSALYAPFEALQVGWPAGHGLAGDEVFLGAVLVASLLVLVVSGRRGAGAWLLTGGGLLLLALGPTLHVGQADLARGAMPWAWLGRAIPPLGLSRAPVRLVHLGGLALLVALAVLASRPRALGVEGRAGSRPPSGAPPWSWLARLRRSGRVRAAGWAALLLVLALERWPARAVATEPVVVPEAYRRLAATPGSFAILQSPEDSYVHWMRYLFWQTVHAKPMVLGYVSRLPAGADRWLEELRAAPAPERAARLRAAGVRYLVVHPAAPVALGQEPRLVPLFPEGDD